MVPSPPPADTTSYRRSIKAPAMFSASSRERENRSSLGTDARRSLGARSFAHLALALRRTATRPRLALRRCGLRTRDSDTGCGEVVNISDWANEQSPCQRPPRQNVTQKSKLPPT